MATKAHGKDDAKYGKSDPSVNSEITYSAFRVLRRLTEKVEPYPVALSYIGQVIQQIQWVSLVYAPIYQYSWNPLNLIPRVLLVFSAPLADGTYGPLSYTVYTALVCIFAVLAFATLMGFIVAIFATRLSEYTVYLTVQRAAMEIVSGWLLLPLLHLFLGGMMCSGGEVVGGAFGSVQCGDILRIVNIAIGCLGICSTFAVGLVMCLVFDFDPESTHPCARPHGYYDLIQLCAKVVLAILFHLLVSTGVSFTVFSFVALAVFLCLFATVCFMMPYYNYYVPSMHAMTMACCFSFAFVDVLVQFDVPGFSRSTKPVKSVSAAAVVPIMAAGGWYMATMRRSALLENYLLLLRDYGVVPEHVARIPLPRSHRRSRWHVQSPVLLTVERDFEQEIVIAESIVERTEQAEQDNVNAAASPAAGGRGAERPGMTSETKTQFELLVPYVSRVYISTDVELATRFLRSYRETTNDALELTAVQLGYALRIFTDSLTYFTRSPHVTVSLASYLFHYCDRAESVIDILDEMNQDSGGRMDGVDLMTQYKAYRLWYTAKDSLGYRDSAHLYALQRARLFHRQALATTKRFWQTLLTYKLGDQIELVRISDMLALQRRGALSAYKKALSISPDDTVTLGGIADFVEEVLAAREVAQEVRYAIDMIEERKQRRRSRRRGGGSSGGGGSMTGSVFSGGGSSLGRGASLASSRNGTMLLRFDDIMAATSRGEVTHTQSSWERTFFLVLLFICLFLLVAGSVVMVAMSVQHSGILVRAANAIHEAYSAQGDGYNAMYLSGTASVYFYENQCNANAAKCAADMTYLTMLQNVNTANLKMRAKMNTIMWGTYGIPYGTLAFEYVTKGLIGIRFYPQDADSFYFPGIMTASSGPDVSVYAYLTSEMQSVGTPQSLWSAASLVTGYLAELVNRMQHASLTYQHYLQFITDGGFDTYLSAIASLCRSMEADMQNQRTTILIAVSVSFGVLILASLIAMASFYINLCWIAKNRVLLTGVFSFIPVLFLEQLYDEAASRLGRFDTIEPERNSTSLQLGNEEEPGAQVPATVPSETAGTDNGGDPTSTDGAPSQSNATSSLHNNQMFIRNFLSRVPEKSCLKKRLPRNGRMMHNADSKTDSASPRSVRFLLDSEDLVDQPKPRLFEPVAIVDGSGEDIIAELEKNLLEMDKEARRENEMAGRRHDTSTSDRMVAASYRLVWCDIKERLMGWSQSVALFDVLYTGILIPALLLMFVAMVVLVAEGMKENNQTLPEAQIGLSELTLLYNYVANFNKMDIAVSSFMNFFYPTYAQQALDYIFVKTSYNDLSEGVQQQYDPGFTQTIEYVQDLRAATERPTLSDAIYCALAARAGYAMGQFDLAAHPYLAIFFYSEDEASLVHLSTTYPNVFAQPSQYVIEQLDDYPTTGQAMYEAVLPLHRRDRFFEDTTNLRSALSTASQMMTGKVRENIRGYLNQASKLLLVATVLSGISIGGGILACVVAKRRKLGLAFYIPLIIAIICSAVTVVFAPLLIKKIREQDDDIMTMQASLELVSFYRTSLFQRTARIEQFFYIAKDLGAATIQEIYSYSPDNNAQYLSVIKAFPSVAVQAERLRSLDATLWEIQQVGLFLSYAGKAKAAGSTDLYPPSPPFLSTYNYASEPTYEYDQETFGTDHPNLMYSRPSVDLTKSADQLQEMARFALFGLRGSYYYFTTFAAVDDIFNAIDVACGEIMVKNGHSERTLFVVLLVFTGVGMACMLVTSVLPLLRFVMGIAEGKNRRWLVRATVHASYWNILRSVLIAVGVACVLACLQFVLILIPLKLDEQSTSIAINSSSRIGAVYATLELASYGEHAALGNGPTLAGTAFADLGDKLDVLENARNFLYFRNTATKGGYTSIATLSNDQRRIMFASSTTGQSVDALMQQWINKVQSLVNFAPAVAPGPGVNPASPTPQDLYVVSPAVVQDVSATVTWMENNVATLMNGLVASDSAYRLEIQKALKMPIIPTVIFFVCILIVVAYLSFHVMPWFLRLVSREERETRVLLRAIPSAAFEAAPSVALFMESGIIEDENDHAALLSSYPFSQNIRRFLDEWQLRDPSDPQARPVQEICRTHLELQSSGRSGVVLCDAHGTIVFTNSTLLEWTRHDNLVNRSVDVLMPSSVAAIHSQFMQRYMQAPKIGGPRTIDAIASTADGEAMHVIIKKAEAPTRDGTMYFIAELFRYPGVSLHPKGNKGTAFGDSH